MDYFPYGKILREFIKTPEKYVTTGHERDTEIGLDYRGARFYDSDVARFLSLDPLAAQFPEWSDYNYVLGNPMMFIDPDGKAPKPYYIRSSYKQTVSATIYPLSKYSNGGAKITTTDARTLHTIVKDGDNITSTVTTVTTEQSISLTEDSREIKSAQTKITTTTSTFSYNVGYKRLGTTVNTTSTEREAIDFQDDGQSYDFTLNSNILNNEKSILLAYTKAYKKDGRDIIGKSAFYKIMADYSLFGGVVGGAANHKKVIKKLPASLKKKVPYAGDYILAADAGAFIYRNFFEKRRLQTESITITENSQIVKDEKPD
jgi:RHS repeat-associated protein